MNGTSFIASPRNTFSYNTARKNRGASVDNLNIRANGNRFGWGVLIKCLCLSFGVLWFAPFVAESATRSDLDAAINNVKLQSQRNSVLSQEILSVLSMVTAPTQSLTVGHAGSTGTVVALPVYYKASTAPVSALQFDVGLSTGLTLTSVQPGLSSLASGKQVQANPVTNGQRIIIFGLNQVVIPSGPVAILNINLGGNVGKCVIPLSVTIGSSPSGNGVPITGKAGSVVKLQAR